MIQLPTNPDTYYFLAASGERHRLLPAHHSLAYREHATTSVDHGVDDVAHVVLLEHRDPVIAPVADAVRCEQGRRPRAV